MPLNRTKIREWIDDECDGSVTEAVRRFEIRPQNLHRLLSSEEASENIKLSNLLRMADAMGIEPATLIRRVRWGEGRAGCFGLHRGTGVSPVEPRYTGVSDGTPSETMERRDESPRDVPLP